MSCKVYLLFCNIIANKAVGRTLIRHTNRTKLGRNPPSLGGVPAFDVLAKHIQCFTCSPANYLEVFKVSRVSKADTS